MVAFLGILAAASAAGFRLALPLLVVLLLSDPSRWQDLPVVGAWPPVWVLTGLVIGTILELVIARHPWGQRLLLPLQVLLSPVVGALLGVTLADLAAMPQVASRFMVLSGAGLALILQLVQVGWFYRRGRLPRWVVFGQDSLCALLAVFALKAPHQGGLMALFLLWLAVRISRDWQTRYAQQRGAHPPD